MDKTRKIELWVVLCSLLLGSISTVYAESNSEKAGDILQILIPATAYSITFYLNNSEGRNQFYKSFFTNLGVTGALKFFIDKKRPIDRERNSKGCGKNSFPSGRTSAAFQGAAFIQKRYGWKYGLPAYALASYVGWSRIEGESDKHDVTDVLGERRSGY